MTHKEKALQYFSDKFHCSQSVLAAFAPELGLTEEQALKLGACFGAGMRKGEVCGACTGALMVLGLMYGQFDKDDLESRMRANKVNVELLNGFAEKNGSEEGVKEAREKGLFTEFCPKMVACAVDVLEEIIQKYQ